MRPSHWIIGCALCLVGIGSAVAASLDTQSVDTVSHGAVNSSPRGATDGDSLGLNRDSGTTNSNAGAPGASSNGNDHSEGAASAPTPSRRPHLGWQSLLPGSIQ